MAATTQARLLVRTFLAFLRKRAMLTHDTCFKPFCYKQKNVAHDTRLKRESYTKALNLIAPVVQARDSTTTRHGRTESYDCT